MLNENEPDPIRPETVATMSLSSMKSAIMPDATAIFKAMASLGILLLSKLCIYAGKDTFITGELSASNL